VTALASSPLDQKFLPKVDLPGPKRGGAGQIGFGRNRNLYTFEIVFFWRRIRAAESPAFFPELASILVAIVNKTYARNHVYGGLVDLLGGRSAGQGPSERHLLGEIYASADDDDLRQVYADLLLERGDPRGELIALQYKERRGSNSCGSQTRATAIRAARTELVRRADSGFSWAPIRKGA
jgi:uncharacterized protein (TIGR02996 family)